VSGLVRAEGDLPMGKAFLGGRRGGRRACDMKYLNFLGKLNYYNEKSIIKLRGCSHSMGGYPQSDRYSNGMPTAQASP
jgi:hypothetical protein